MNSIDPALIEQFRGKKFLFVLGHYRAMGGAERQALILAEELKQKVGCEIAFLAWASGPRIEAELKALDIPAYTFPLNWNRTGKLGHFFTLRRLAKFIRTEIKPDYLLPYIGFNCKIMGLIWRQCNARFTWWNQRDEGRDIYGSRIEHKVIRTVPSIVSNSFEGRDFLVRTFDMRPDEIEVINNGIRIPETSDRAIWRRKLNLPSDALLITMMANLTGYKDHETLVRAFAKLRQTEIGKRSHLCLAGRFGDTTERLKVMGFEHNLCGHLHLPGAVHSADDLWAATDLAVHSSITEGCPNAALEAMAHALAVCGTNISGMRQAVGEKSCNVVLTDPRDEAELFQIMHRLLADNVERTALGEKNRARVEEHFNPLLLTETVLRQIQNKGLN